MLTLYKLNVLDIPMEEPLVETLEVNGTHIQFEDDAGCEITVLNHTVYKSFCGGEV